MTKERIYRENILYYISLLINLILIILLFELLPISPFYKEINYKIEILGYIIISSFNFYTIIYSTLYSNNKYSIQALIRGINQLVSYEINISIILLSFIILSHSFTFIDIILYQIDSLNIYYLPLFIILFISLLAESNRIPFDLLEGESELVAGRLTEYSSIEFTLIYISEYFILLFNSSFLLFFFFSFTYLSLSFLLLLLLFIISRALLPRYTYNNIIYIN
jgi:NADH:ubiquinone oxidoreductase subunit H